MFELSQAGISEAVIPVQLQFLEVLQGREIRHQLVRQTNAGKIKPPQLGQFSEPLEGHFPRSTSIGEVVAAQVQLFQAG